jgi:hypothetical protein
MVRRNQTSTYCRNLPLEPAISEAIRDPAYPSETPARITGRPVA